MKACGLSDSYLPSRRTFDRRKKTISSDIKGRIAAMENLFVFEGLVEPYVIAIDSTLLKSKGHVWYASSMSKGIVPRSGIDTDSRWGFSHTRGWIFGYKLHLVSSTDSLIVPLAAGVTTANIPDNQVYPDLLSSQSSQSSPNNYDSLSLETLKKIHFVAADPGYDDKSLHDLSMNMGFQLVCPVKRYKKTPEERPRLVDFYESALGQVIYSKRCISIEPLIEHIKSVFRIDPVPARRYLQEDMIRYVALFFFLYCSIS